MNKALLLLILSCGYFFSRAQSDGSLDLTFDTDGKVTIDNGNTDDGNDVVILENKSIIVGGTTYTTGNDFFLCSFLSTGALNPGFGVGGKLTMDIDNGSDDYLFGLAVDSSERIIGTGYSFIGSDQYIIVVRMNADGTPDPAFGTNGIVKILPALKNNAYDVVVQSDNKIVIGGFVADGLTPAKALIIRLNEDGNLDGTFGDNGVWEGSPDPTYDVLAYALALQSDGKILIGGYQDLNGDAQFAVGRILPGGSMDVSFDTDGWAVKNLVTPGFDVVRSVAVQPDGKILLAGESNGEIAVSRLNSDGTDDVDFASSGTFKDALDANDDVLYSVILQSDGNILAAGGGSINDNVDFLLIRLTTDGQLDPTFDVDGVVYTDFLGSNDFVHSMLLQPDGRIVAAGSAFNYYWTDVAVSRYATGVSTGTNPIINSPIAIYPNPSDGNFEVMMDDYSHAEINYQLTDAAGKVLANGSVPPHAHLLSFELNDPPSGMYFIVLMDQETGKWLARDKVVIR